MHFNENFECAVLEVLGSECQMSACAIFIRDRTPTHQKLNEAFTSKLSQFMLPKVSQSMSMKQIVSLHNILYE